ncbi:MAG: DUF262 domain-containing protein [Bacteroidales bacterium]|nr:DUF262 domain-containing protein [Bacteroidales bacterium]
METKTFKTIFSPYTDKEGNKVEIKKIVIPKIQRDFAYGRTDEKNRRKRDNFLDALFDAICNNPVTLDFVYGDIKDGILTPLDGQQRLTTLFLLYWYASKKENVPNDECSFLKNFGYETRPSARKFCEAITSKIFVLESNEKLSEQIKDKNWFPLEWQHDATIASMLVMLDAIQEKFANVDSLFARLEKISFYFLPIEDMGLTDELYIKMNSRGKPLTQFEHFKAEFEKQLKLADENIANRISSKIDREWTDLLWQYRNSGTGDDRDNTTDDEFLRYFIFICNIICYQKGGSPKTSDEFDLIKDFFTIQGEDEEQKIQSKNQIIENALVVERYFDCWLDNNKKSIPIQQFFESFSAKEHSSGKIKTNYNINLFEDCLKNYADIVGKNRRKFTLNQIILLYTFVVYRLNLSTVSEDEFRRRLRIINNLILNSSDQISDSEDRQGGNRLPAILRQVDSIIIHGQVADSTEIGINFNPSQLDEEKAKWEFTKNNPDKAESLFVLEDHELLYGQIAIVGLNYPEHFDRFVSLFKCDWDLVDCAMFAIGDYKQKERNGWRFQLGSSMSDGFAWKTLFHKSENYLYFSNTQKILSELLMRTTSFSNYILKSIIDDYLADCESKNDYPWTYYYVKYQDFRTGRYGKYWWDNFARSPYVFTTIHQKQKPSQNSYNPFLKALNDNLWREHLGKYINIDEEKCLKETQSSYQVVLYDENEDKVLKEFVINQNGNGIDTENRIEKMKTLWTDVISSF